MKKIILMTAVLGISSVGATVASANTGAYNAFNAHYNNPASCTSCHSGSPGVITQLGIDWKAQGGTSQAGPSTQSGWDALDAKYATTYGGVNPNWTFTAPTPVGTASVTGCISSPSTLSWMLFAGMMALLVGMRRKA